MDSDNKSRSRIWILHVRDVVFNWGLTFGKIEVVILHS